jgi:large conductance mechanosensitive channel
MSMMSEFKSFAMKGNLVDIAVAFVMGGAFGKVISSFTDGIVAPIIGLLTGGADFSKLKWIIRKAEMDAAGAVANPEVAISYGVFLTNIIDFIIVAFVMFMIVKAVNAMKKEEAAAQPPAPPRTEVLLEEIRNLLKK